MADLFDMRIGGAGWHLTSHLIAIAALFVACFAITGYITFRDGSIHAGALDKTADADDDLKVNDHEATGNLTVGGNSTMAGTLAVTGDTTLSGDIISNSLRYRTLDFHGLSQDDLTDTEMDAGPTLVANRVHYAAYDGGDASACVLPAATKGTVLFVVLTAQADGTANLTFTRAGTDTFAVQSLNFPTVNVADTALGPYTLSTDYTPAATSTLGNIVTAAANSTVWTITATVTNNMTNIGAVFGFYCKTAGEWLVSFRSSELGNGAINGTFTIA